MPTPNADDLLRTADHAPPLESEAAPEAITTDAPPDREVGATPSFLAGQETITFQRQRDAPSRDGSATSPSEPPHPSIPGYEIEAVLGRGGMGVVYQARHVGLNRVVALKMILAGGHAGPDDLARFRGEAEAVARLNHPNVVQVYDVGESGGLPYFSLEFVEGGSLDRKLAGTPLPPMEAAALVETLARAMAAAHAAGLVHRDLKPANVLLAADGTPKVTDFGLAKKLDLAAPGQEPAAGLTASGAILGTPSYMAPEQAGGKSNEIGPACDIYALGAILYECLAGRPPFRAATPLDTIMQVVSDEPVPPRQLNAKVPVDLETICLKCLQKEAGRRYASAAALADDLRRFLEGRPIVARPVGRLGWAAKWVRRNPVVAALVVAVGLALAIGTAGTMWFAVQAAASARDFANKAAEAQEKERYALFQKSQADEARIRADSLRLSSQSELIRPRNPGLALLLAIEATQRNPNLLAQNALYAALDECAEERTLIGHRREVAGTAFSPDSRGVVTWAHDNSARLWEIATGREIALLRHSGCVQARFSPDGRRVLTLSLARYSFGYQSFGGIPRPTASVWDAATGTEAATWKLPDNDAKSPGGAAFPDLRHVIGFSPDGTRVVLTAGGLPAPCVWEVATGRELFALEGHEAPVVAVDYSPDGRYVAQGPWTTRPASGTPPRASRSRYSAAMPAAFAPSSSVPTTAACSAWATATGM